MTEVELSELLQDCPTLYHMAQRGSWPKIREHGLLSTSAILDKFGIAGEQRQLIETQRRPLSVLLENEDFGSAVIRDQSPIDDVGLIRCLQDGLTPEDWYRSLNGKVFFWLTRSRLLRLLNAGTYRTEGHDVLELDAAPLVMAYMQQIWLCPMNSGCTKPYPHPRGKDTFARVPDYPYAGWKAKRRPGERVVELAVDYAVADISRFVKRVVRMKGHEELEVVLDGD